jgi:hypothetical protein
VSDHNFLTRRDESLAIMQTILSTKEQQQQQQQDPLWL